jgi:hypothetical protein
MLLDDLPPVSIQLADHADALSLSASERFSHTASANSPFLAAEL